MAVTVALVDVVVDDATGFDVQVKAPRALVAPEVAKQKVIVVLAPLAETVPFNVADVAPIEDASLVVAIGTPAEIVKVNVFSAVAFALSVTRKVKLVELAVAVGVPVI